MKRNKLLLILAGLLFMFALGLFAIQIGYLLLHDRLQMEYIDNRLFYIFNISIVIFLFAAIMMLFIFTRKFKVIVTGFVGLFIIVNVFLAVQSNQEIKNITSISPNLKNVFTIKKDKLGEGVYYRSYYGIVTRPKDVLDHSISGDYHVEWIEDDIAVFTYENANNNVHAFVGTYGDRSQGGVGSYYNVGPQTQGVWQGEDAEVVSKPEGIEVIVNGRTEFFGWEKVQQYGTLAIVLKQDRQASWVIGLNKGFEVRSDDSKLPTDSISLYKTTLEGGELYHLNYVKPNEFNSYRLD